MTRTGTSLGIIFVIAIVLVGTAGIFGIDSLPGGLTLWSLTAFFVVLSVYHYYEYTD